MKKILLNITLFTFMFNQAFAYTPNVEQQEINKLLTSLEGEEVTTTKNISSAQSEYQFNKSITKMLKSLNK